MKKHELLKYAYDNYPKGTVARFGGKLPDHTSTGKFEITDLNHNNSLQVMSDNGLECFYADGEWAEIIPEKPERNFIMKSEDGVDLYEQENYHHAYFNSEWEYKGLVGNPTISEHNPAYHDPAHNKAFSTFVAAVKWIEEQNKPKHATVKLYRHKEYKSAEVTNDKITIRDGNDIYYLKASDIEDMYHALKSL